MTNVCASASPTSTLTIPAYRSSLKYLSLRKVKERPFEIYETRVPVTSVIGIPNDENVREYLMNIEGRKKRKTQVHRDIEDTLRNRADMFDLLNSGITIVTSGIKIDNRECIVDIGANASVINGAQTKGVIEDLCREGVDLTMAFVRLEIIVCDEEDVIADISIARNSQNEVLPISIAGRKGVFDELEERLRMCNSRFQLRKSETDLGDEFLETERLLQVVASMVPTELGIKHGYNRVDAYGKKTKWIKMFVKIHDSTEPALREIYQFHLDVAYDAMCLYERWKVNQAFKGCGLWCITRDKGEIIEVPDGVIFPIISAYSNFCRKGDDGKWRIIVPANMQEKKLVDAACRAYAEIANRNPNTMGKKPACYSSISSITEIYRELNQ
jgi:hypothetical protein